MGLDQDARAYVNEVVRKAVDEQIKLDKEGCSEFVLATLHYRSESYWALGRGYSLFHNVLEDTLKDVFKEALAEVFTPELRQGIRERIHGIASDDKLYFAAEAATQDFLERLKGPIKGNAVSFMIEEDSDSD